VLAAVITAFFVPPDKAYLDYFDWKTLACLFITLAVICALRNIKFFTILARRLVMLTGNLRNLFLMLLCITFIGSMLIANDMALITFLPLGYFALSVANEQKYMAYLFILQNIAANLGGMLTPFGNPQNLYLYSKFNIPDGEFMLIMLPPFLLAVLMITVCCLIFVKPEPLEVQEDGYNTPVARVIIYLLLFALSIAIVFRGIPYPVGLIVIPLFLIFMDREALKGVDYGLLLTFVFFFIFSGNMARIGAVSAFFSYLLSIDTLVFSALSCQVISNVPSAILLSEFTTNYRELLLGVNIGGVGTLISSLASLITFKEYTKQSPKHTISYIVKFSVYNFTFLILLVLICSIFR
jgi:Na+/H+ antiporter NhaD/arsenite permease-like protein